MRRRSGRLGLPSNRPHEADQLASDGCADDRCLLAPGDQRPISRGQPRLGLPGDLADLRRRLFESVELHLADLWRESVRPRALDDELANPAVAGLGDAAAPDGVAGGTFAPNPAEIGHQLSRT